MNINDLMAKAVSVYAIPIIARGKEVINEGQINKMAKHYRIYFTDGSRIIIWINPKVPNEVWAVEEIPDPNNKNGYSKNGTKKLFVKFS